MKKFCLTVLQKGCLSALIVGGNLSIHGNSLAVTNSEELAAMSQSTIAEVRITGNSTIQQDALEHNLVLNGIVAGNNLNPQRLEKLRQHIINHYRYFRRYEAQVETRLTQRDDGQVAVELFIDESLASRGLPEGYNDDPYADHVYTEKHRRAYETGSLDDDDEDLPDATISLGLGYGSKGVNYQASVIKRRLFDTDASLRLSALRDRYETNVDLGLSKPNFLQPGLRLDANVFYDSYDNHRSRSAAPYKRKTYGAQFLLNKPLDRDGSIFGGLRYTHNKLSKIQPEYSRALYLKSIKVDRWDFSANDIDLILGWKFNNFNHRYFPTKGVGLKLEGNISLPGSDNRYYKVKVDAQGYYPLDGKEDWIIAPRASFGYAKGMDSREVPFYQNFTAGGQDTLRGFAYGTVGPRALYSNSPQTRVSTLAADYQQMTNRVVGGNALAAASVELVVPNFYLKEKYRSQFRTSLFVDAATVWDTQKKDLHALVSRNGRSRDIRVSAGIAVQWQFPMGVLSVSYAVPVKKYPGDRLEQFQLSLRSSF